MKEQVKKFFRPWALAGLILGGTGGWLYYYYIGCQQGSCPIWSTPWLSIAWGALVGYLLLDMLSGKKPGRGKAEDGES